MKHTPARTLSALALVLATGACGRDTTVYPSLSVRPVEKLGFGEPEAKPAVATPDPALDAAIGTLSTQLDTIAKGFARDAATTETAARAARGKAAGSEPWLTAQTALAGLDDWRAQASGLVTDVERYATDRAAKLEPDYPALTTLREKAQAEADRESATITRIQAMLPAS